MSEGYSAFADEKEVLIQDGFEYKIVDNVQCTLNDSN